MHAILILCLGGQCTAEQYFETPAECRATLEMLRLQTLDQAACVPFTFAPLTSPRPQRRPEG